MAPHKNGLVSNELDILGFQIEVPMVKHHLKSKTWASVFRYWAMPTYSISISEPRYVISNHVAFWQL